MNESLSLTMALVLGFLTIAGSALAVIGDSFRSYVTGHAQEPIYDVERTLAFPGQIGEAGSEYACIDGAQTG